MNTYNIIEDIIIYASQCSQRWDKWLMSKKHDWRRIAQDEWNNEKDTNNSRHIRWLIYEHKGGDQINTEYAGEH